MGSSDVAQAKKNVSKKLARKRERNFLNFLEYCLKPSNQKSEICIFLNVFKCKVTFFLNSSGRLLSSESVDVFTDSLAHSVRALWPIITSKGRIVASTRVEGTVTVISLDVFPKIVKLIHVRIFL